MMPIKEGYAHPIDQVTRIFEHIVSLKVRTAGPIQVNSFLPAAYQPLLSAKLFADGFERVEFVTDTHHHWIVVTQHTVQQQISQKDIKRYTRAIQDAVSRGQYEIVVDHIEVIITVPAFIRSSVQKNLLAFWSRVEFTRDLQGIDKVVLYE